MPEHLIQLRRAWDLLADVGVLRVDLPTIWGPRAVPLRLARSFRRPPIDPESERLTLRLREVAGLRALRLNGQEPAPIPPGTSGLDLDLPALLPDRNRLELEVDPAAWDDPAAPWGAIALVVRPR